MHWQELARRLASRDARGLFANR